MGVGQGFGRLYPHGYLLKSSQYTTVDDPNGYLLIGGQYTTIDDPAGVLGNFADAINEIELRLPARVEL
jgi:hypothetical protein